jgi:hypothetical protein
MLIEEGRQTNKMTIRKNNMCIFMYRYVSVRIVMSTIKCLIVKSREQLI